MNIHDTDDPSGKGKVIETSTDDKMTFIASGFDTSTAFAVGPEGETLYTPVFSFEVLGRNQLGLPDEDVPREVVCLIMTEEAIQIVLGALVKRQCDDVAEDIKLLLKAHNEVCGKPCAPTS